MTSVVPFCCKTAKARVRALTSYLIIYVRVVIGAKLELAAVAGSVGGWLDAGVGLR